MTSRAAEAAIEGACRMGKKATKETRPARQWQIIQSASAEVDKDVHRKVLDLWVDLIADVVVKAALKEREQHRPDCERWETFDANTVT